MAGELCNKNVPQKTTKKIGKHLALRSQNKQKPYNLFSPITNLAAPRNIIALVQTAMARPHPLALDLLSSNNNIPIVLHDGHMFDRRILGAPSTRLRAPEDQVALLAVGIFDVLALSGLVLLPGAVRQDFPLAGRLAHGVLGETGAVKSASGRTIAVSSAPFVWNTALL